MSESISKSVESAAKIFREAFESTSDFKVDPNASSFIPTAMDKWIGTGALIVMSVFAIFLGTMHSVRRLKKLKKGTRVESLSYSDVVGAPFIASFLLFGLFVLLKLIPKDYLMTLLSLYVVIFGWLSVGITFDLFLQYIYAPFHSLRRFKASIVEQTRTSIRDYVKFDFTSSQIISLLVTAIPCLYYVLVNKFWLINNMIGIGMCARMISLIHVNRFHHIAVLMCGLFAYDIFWVFFSNVMVYVAKSIDLPIKLLFPSDLLLNGPIRSKHFSMLGLGDIALPGLYLAFLRRFDAARESKSNSKKSESTFNNMPYFWPAIVSYVVSLIASSAAMIIYKNAQPALLYIVPSLLITTLIQAALKHEVKDLIAYHDVAQVYSTKNEDDDSQKSSRSKASPERKSQENRGRNSRSKDRGNASPRRRTPPRRCQAMNSSSSKI